MALRLRGHVELPAHRGQGGFDHAAVHHRLGLLYLAHTANDALDVIDTATQHHVGSIEKLPGVAGAPVSEPRDRVFTAERGENTRGSFSPGRAGGPVRGPVRVAPNS